MFGEYDISFCFNKECPRENCRRHYNNIPKCTPVSCMMIEPKDFYQCDEFYRMTSVVKDKKGE